MGDVLENYLAHDISDDSTCDCIYLYRLVYGQRKSGNQLYAFLERRSAIIRHGAGLDLLRFHFYSGNDRISGIKTNCLRRTKNLRG